MSNTAESSLDFVCYEMDSFPVDLHPAGPRRDWMDRTPHSFAYKCLPLTMANSHGWEIRCPATFTARWNGGSEAGDLQVIFEESGHAHRVASHFGSGILTFVPSVVLRTPPGYDLWVSGPANRFKDGAQALSALIETDWMPYTFTMNWKITRPDCDIRFEAGEPYCFFFPVTRSVVERCRPEIRPLDGDPELVEAFEVAYGRRVVVHDKAKLREEAPDTRKRILREDNWYMRGIEPDGSRQIPTHRTKIRPRPFERRSEPSP